MVALKQGLGGMKSGQENHLTHDASGKTVKVRYEAEQAVGDDNRPARGYTVGHYHVHGPGEDDYASFRHTPQGPTLEGAKQYAADQAADHISRLFNDRRG